MQNKKIDEIQKGWISKSVMIKSLGITERGFDKWQIKSVGKVGRISYYTAADVLANRLDCHIQKNAVRIQEEEGTTEYEKYRLTKASADAQELKNELARQEVVPVGFATFSLNKMAASVAGVLDSLPLNMQRNHPELSAAQIDGIRREIARGMNTVVTFAETLHETLDEYLAQTTQ